MFTMPIATNSKDIKITKINNDVYKYKSNENIFIKKYTKKRI